MSRNRFSLNQPAAGLPCHHVWGDTGLVDKMMTAVNAGFGNVHEGHARTLPTIYPSELR